MHVLMTTDTLNSNLWAYTRELVTGLIGRGMRVTLVSFGEIPLPEQTAWMEPLRGLEYRPTAFRLDWMHEGQQDFAESSSYLRALLDELRPHVLHANHVCYGALAFSGPRVVVAHGDLITWWQSVHGREPKDSAWLRWYRHTTTEGLSQASAVVAASNWMLDALHAGYPAAMNGTVINHGRNPVHFNPYVTKSDSVLAIGRLLDPAAQVHLLAERPHAVPVCVVDAKQPDHAAETQVCADVKFENGSQGVVMRGPRSESQLRLLYSRASMYVSPSRYEPSGMTILEAALSRCALILNDIPAMREIWGPAAVYFRTNDADGLCDAVRILNNDPVIRRSFANRAFNRARECYNANRMTDSYVQLYRDLANQRKKVA
ncbi:MAG TPA: glycosyltransferase family 4 protein [Terriglobales bacterium]|nr:glycosyltransferase family 4 protein [Terriglobales bacterium]